MSYSQGPSAILYNYTPPSRHSRLPSRRLSISSNSQWTTAQSPNGGLSPSTSGYALSPSSGNAGSSSSSSFDTGLHRQQQQQQQQQAQSYEHGSPSSLLNRRPSHGRTIRQLDPVSIFERLGLGTSSSSGTEDGSTRTTQLTSHTSPSRSNNNTHPGPSPGREDAHLPSTEFEGIPDTTDVMTPMPGSVSSSSVASETGEDDDSYAYENYNTGPHRRTLSNAAATLPPMMGSSTASTNIGNVSIRQRSSPSPAGSAPPPRSDDDAKRNDDDATMAISPSGSTPRNVLLDIASVPPVDVADPTLHPAHALVLDYPPTCGDSNITPTSPGDTAASSRGNNNNNSKIIPVNEDILLPFVDRPVEVRELLEEEARNRGLCDRLKEVFAPHPTPLSSSSSSQNATTTLSLSSSSSASTPLSQSTSSSSEGGNNNKHTTTWKDVESVLYKAREEMPDQEWIDTLKSLIFPRSTALWERLRACLGIDVDDEQGGDRYEELSSDFNPTGPSSAYFNPPPAVPPTSGSDVFSFVSPNRVPAPALPEDMLSPRAVLRTHNNNNNNNNASTAPISIPGASLGLGLGAKHSPAAYSSPGYGSTGISPVPSPGLPAPNRQFDRTAILGGGGGGGASQLSTLVSNPDIAGNRSPSKSANPFLSGGSNGAGAPGGGSGGGGGGDSARMHRRTSSGGSSFRRSFAMSSISEDAPVVDFGTTPSSTGPSTPIEIVDIQNTSSSTGDQLPLQQQSYPFHGSALSSSAGSSSFLPSTAVTGHSSVHGQALPSPSSFSNNSSTGGGIFPPAGHGAIPSSLGLQVDTPPLSSLSSSTNSPNLSRSPSWNLGSAANPARMGASHSFSAAGSANVPGGGFPSSPSFNSTYNKRAYDEYNPVFESDDGSSVAGSVRSTGRGPGMRRSFGQAEALSPIRGPAQRASGGFALAGVNTKKASPKTGTSSTFAPANK